MKSGGEGEGDELEGGGIGSLFGIGARFFGVLCCRVGT